MRVTRPRLSTTVGRRGIGIAMALLAIGLATSPAQADSSTTATGTYTSSGPPCPGFSSTFTRPFVITASAAGTMRIELVRHGVASGEALTGRLSASGSFSVSGVMFGTEHIDGIVNGNRATGADTVMAQGCQSNYSVVFALDAALVLPTAAPGATPVVGSAPAPEAVSGFAFWPFVLVGSLLLLLLLSYLWLRNRRRSPTCADLDASCARARAEASAAAAAAAAAHAAAVTAHSEYAKAAAELAGAEKRANRADHPHPGDGSIEGSEDAGITLTSHDLVLQRDAEAAARARFHAGTSSAEQCAKELADAADPGKAAERRRAERVRAHEQLAEATARDSACAGAAATAAKAAADADAAATAAAIRADEACKRADECRERVDQAKAMVAAAPEPVTVGPATAPPPPREVCREGTRTTRVLCETGDVNIYLPAAAAVSISGPYEFTDEEVNAAVDGLNEALVAVDVMTEVIPGLESKGAFAVAVTDPVTSIVLTVGGWAKGQLISGSDTVRDATMAALSHLAEVMAPKREFGDWTFTCPMQTYRFRCEALLECQEGDWVELERTFVGERVGGLDWSEVWHYSDQWQAVTNPDDAATAWRKMTGRYQGKNQPAMYAIKACRNTCGRG